MRKGLPGQTGADFRYLLLSILRRGRFKSLGILSNLIAGLVEATEAQALVNPPTKVYTRRYLDKVIRRDARLDDRDAISSRRDCPRHSNAGRLLEALDKEITILKSALIGLLERIPK